MTIGGSFPNRHLLRLFPLVFATIITSVYGTCQLSFEQGNKLYNYSLTNPIRNFPHGILSEDGFYKVAVNGTVLWFQLCDAMIFNHDPPTCVECGDCGGISRCGMGCSALVANIIGEHILRDNTRATEDQFGFMPIALQWREPRLGTSAGGSLGGVSMVSAGYPVCTTLGYSSSTSFELIDKTDPLKGITAKLSNRGSKSNCSLAVSVVCDTNGVQGPQTLELVGTCDYDPTPLLTFLKSSSSIVDGNLDMTLS
ncbi:hypothetical protein MTR67_024614 [Solanum verrucosum]|uniref:Uncharacterized protein n=1 Tax=Solanum verrucosum TaxID=315347 RepID=A0AAF0QVM5_SOLVR|nr:hypothetical protein MTR67_024614 [Solanum verrucosum]